MAQESYRGYKIIVEPNGDGWRVWAHPMTPDLPITRHRSFRVDAASSDEALRTAEAKIDGLFALE